MAESIAPALKVEPGFVLFPDLSEIDPSDTVATTFTLRNPTDEPILWKIKLNNRARYFVAPPCAILPPQSEFTVNIQIASGELPDTPKPKDKFLVSFVMHPDVVLGKDPDSLFRSLQSESQMLRPLRVYFGRGPRRMSRSSSLPGIDALPAGAIQVLDAPPVESLTSPLEGDIATLTSQLALTRSELVKVTSDYNEAVSDREKLTAQVESLHSHRAALEEQCNMLRTEIEETKRDLNEKLHEMDSRATLSDNQLSKVNLELAEAQKELNALQTRYDGVSSDLALSETALMESRIEVTKIMDESSALQADVTTLTADKDSLERKIEKLISRLDDSEQLEAQLHDYEQIVTDKDEEIRVATKQHEAVLAEISDLQDQISLLREAISRSESEAQHARDELSSAHAMTLSLERDRQQDGDELESVVYALLGFKKRFFGMVSQLESDIDALDEAEFSSEQLEDAIGAIRDVTVRCALQEEQLISSTSEIERLQSELMAAEQKAERMVSSEDFSQFEADLRIKVSAVSELENSLKETQLSLANCEEELRDVKQQLEQAETRVSDLASLNGELTAQLASFESRPSKRVDVEESDELGHSEDLREEAIQQEPDVSDMDEAAPESPEAVPEESSSEVELLSFASWTMVRQNGRVSVDIPLAIVILLLYSVLIVFIARVTKRC